ncbi:MAG: DUF86 domain-containing protein [Hyphomicrobiales bacterium]|nr:DUF86 domain-containing protein [Hyphomicrobiales bacterium]
MSDDRGRPWRFYLDDMIGFAEKVVAYARGFDQAGFIGSGPNYDAALRNLELIGEAAIHLPDSIRAVHARIPLAASHRDAQPPDPRLSWPR